MYATLENRQINSLLAINAQKVENALENNRNPRGWAALFLLSSAVTAADYAIGTIWRLPASLICHGCSKNNDKELPSFKDFLSSALRTIYCAIGILIFPIIGIIRPESALDLMETLKLYTRPKQEKVELITVPNPALNISAWEKVKHINQDHLFLADEVVYADRNKKYENPNNQLWEKEWEGPLFVSDNSITGWDQIRLSICLKSTVYIPNENKRAVPTWKAVAALLNIPFSGGDIHVVEKIIHTVYPKTALYKA